MVALLNSSGKEVTTYGFDDTKKAVGVRFMMLKLAI